MIVLDTHVLIWVASDDKKLGRRARATLERAWKADAVAASAITFWEVATLNSRRRVRLPTSVEDWRNSLLTAGLIELPFAGDIALRTVELRGLPVDLADRFIAATALCHRAELMTADDALLDWRHSLTRHDARH